MCDVTMKRLTMVFTTLSSFLQIYT